ncbi:phosphatidylinositol N-acetylglucosaminyltransferase subunit P-like isoform X2 [Salvia hispanica]|uniref:phosphatidylinositol N-acetylglucosaminyltransferase subunit P-like isoform X2 n=1 Tax=Salvia hispanica TaxID=49212 RepID=UPI002008F5DE|nr:phosphatidylinositol N-acetylglucosaminyltransferase subunit P-like isoform X2 [Salvia hispanica]
MTRAAKASFSDASLGGPKLSEVYGFVGSITTIVFTVIFIVWAYVPDHCLHSIGFYHYPNRYWALAVPTYVTVIIVLAIIFYIAANFVATPPPTSLDIMFGKIDFLSFCLHYEFSRELLSGVPSTDGDEHSIEPISDIGIDRINNIMFDSL